MRENEHRVNHDIYTYIRKVWVILFAMVALAVDAKAQGTVQLADTLNAQQSALSEGSRFKVAKTAPDNAEDLECKAMDLNTPENIITETTYDDKSHTYIVGSKIGDSYLSVPLLMTPEEYAAWSMQRSLDAYFRSKNKEEFEKEGKQEKFDFTDMHFDLGPAEKIFGPGGLQIKTQGSEELKFGFNQKSIDNPSLPTRSRNTFGFDFDEKINEALIALLNEGKIEELAAKYNVRVTDSLMAKKTAQ